MATIQRPTLDLNGNVSGFTTHTITNAAAYAARLTTEAALTPLAVDFYPYRIGYTVTWLEP